jgi:hypothetical protein
VPFSESVKDAGSETRRRRDPYCLGRGWRTVRIQRNGATGRGIGGGGGTSALNLNLVSTTVSCCQPLFAGVCDVPSILRSPAPPCLVSGTWDTGLGPG